MKPTYIDEFSLPRDWECAAMISEEDIERLQGQARNARSQHRRWPELLAVFLFITAFWSVIGYGVLKAIGAIR